MLKRSKYALFWNAGQEGAGEMFGYNFLTKGFVRVKPEEREKVLFLVDNPSAAGSDDPLVQELIKGSFLMDESFDETNYLRYRNNRGRYNSQNLSLSLIPTTGCNFGCPYCYEKIENAKVMPAGVQDDLIAWLEKAAPGFKSISISWYGGEPLLCPDIVTGLSRRIRQIGEKNRTDVNLAMVTNGYLLDPVIVDHLAELKLENIQITIDGTAGTHDARRYLKGGQGTYDRIMENIGYAAQKLKSITIRVNLDKDNCGEADRIMDDFLAREWGRKVKFYFAKVEDFTEACADYGGKCLSPAEFSREDVELSRLALSKGLLLAKVPGIKFNYCGGDFVNGYVIGPEGEIYKCWETVGMADQVVGRLTPDGPEVNGQFYEWITFDPFQDECRECQFLPACMGGCPAARFLKKKARHCNPLKHNFREMLEIYYRYKMNNKTAETVSQNQ